MKNVAILLLSIGFILSLSALRNCHKRLVDFETWHNSIALSGNGLVTVTGSSVPISLMRDNPQGFVVSVTFPTMQEAIKAADCMSALLHGDDYALYLALREKP